MLLGSILLGPWGQTRVRSRLGQTPMRYTIVSHCVDACWFCTFYRDAHFKPEWYPRITVANERITRSHLESNFGNRLKPSPPRAGIYCPLNTLMLSFHAPALDPILSGIQRT
ncbi:hypothetical protein KQX54_009062 [Cotesia glomerata]|uniref:Uncharacterized protein n=1 Tax=Cotesia glomerata TaxID=32391 RepID=A0AAV7J2I9_COTGL|nr:hypothetical protein KQX54_009062 [Cotesia glomerata]